MGRCICYRAMQIGPDRDLDIKSERRIKVGDIVAAVNDRFVYEYDFGDSWEHKIVVEKVLPPEPGARYPVCLTGKRVPPEDVGGIWGYAEFVEAIRDPPDRLLPGAAEQFTRLCRRSTQRSGDVIRCGHAFA